MLHDRTLVPWPGLLLGCLLAVANPVFAGVLVVDAAGGGAFTQIQPAVDAALPGDLVLVRAGDYEGFTIAGKSVNVVGDGTTAQHVQVKGVVLVRDTRWPRSPCSWRGSGSRRPEPRAPPGATRSR